MVRSTKGFHMPASWWQRVSQGGNRQKSRPRQRPRTVKPAVEPLEDRTVLTRFFQLPGVADQPLPLHATLAGRDSSFRSEVGCFVVQDAQGRVDGLLPGQRGYARAALRNARLLFGPGAGARSQQSLTLPGGTQLGFYLIQNGSRAGWSARNPGNTPGRGPFVFFAFPAANP